jgi:hypothetical protein
MNNEMRNRGERERRDVVECETKGVGTMGFIFLDLLSGGRLANRGREDNKAINIQAKIFTLCKIQRLQQIEMYAPLPAILSDQRSHTYNSSTPKYIMTMLAWDCDSDSYLTINFGSPYAPTINNPFCSVQIVEKCACESKGFHSCV